MLRFLFEKFYRKEKRLVTDRVLNSDITTNYVSYGDHNILSVKSIEETL